MTQKKIQIYPSILSANFGALAEEAKKAELSGADGIHIDVMDGHFVPNLTLGASAVASINKSTDLFLDVHLMVYNPFDYIETFVAAGADRITFHFEATESVEETIKYIKKCNVQAGLAFCPETSMELIPKYLDKCDLILLMTVNPGFGGQSFIPEVLEKIEFTAQISKDLKVNPYIQVDGGIDNKTAKECVRAGANILVSGSYLYKEADMRKAIASLR